MRVNKGISICARLVGPGKSPVVSLVLGAIIGLASASSAMAQNYPDALGKSNSRLEPYRFIGRLLFFSGDTEYIGTGTVIARRGVLTAAHNLFDPEFGFSTDVEFERGRYGGSVLSRSFPSAAVVLSGYISATENYGYESSQAFARDLGLLRFRRSVAGGNSAPYRTVVSLLMGDLYKESLGYGADTFDGDILLYVDTDEPSEKERSGYFFNEGFVIEGGMSGGPVFVDSPTYGFVVAGVNVSGSDFDTGIRALDRTARRFISANL